jgi:diacylglycerol kinase (ATP)
MRMPERSTRPQRPHRTSFRRALHAAAVGLCDATLRERNLRIHLVLGVVAACGAALLEVSDGERAAVLLCIGAVVAAEAANASIETIVDVLFEGVDERARFAKDAAAGAVLALAAASVVVALVVLAPALVMAIRAPYPGELIFGGTGALIGAAATAHAPGAPTLRRIAVDATVAAVAILVLLLPFARSAPPLAAAALLVAIAAGAGARGVLGRGPPKHAGPPPD